MMENEQAGSQGEFVAAFRRRRMLLLLVAGPVFLITLLIALALPNIYQSAASFRLRDAPASEANNRESYVDQYVTGVEQYVLNGSLAENIVEKVKPYGDLPTGPAIGRLRKNIRVDMIKETILDPQSGHDKDIHTGFTVSFLDGNPKVAHDVAAALSDAFIKGSREMAGAVVADQVTFFSGEADRTRARISDLEKKVADFKNQNFEQLPESAQANQTQRSQMQQEMSQIDRELSTLQQNRIFLAEQLQTAKNGTDGGNNLAMLEDQYKRMATSYDPSHPDMVAMRRQIEAARRGGGNAGTGDGSLQSELANQRAILAEARQRYSEDHPDVKRLVATIKQLEQRVAAGERGTAAVNNNTTPVVMQLNTQIHATDTQIGALTGRRAELRTRLQDLDRRLALTPHVEREYETLNRDLGTARQQYDQLLTQRLNAEVAVASIAGGTSDKFELVQPAFVPDRPAKPFRLGIIVMGLIGALVIASIVAVVTEAMDATVRGSRDLLSSLSLTPLAVIPEIRNSVFNTRRRREITRTLVATALGIPVLYVGLHLLLR